MPSFIGMVERPELLQNCSLKFDCSPCPKVPSLWFCNIDPFLSAKRTGQATQQLGQKVTPWSRQPQGSRIHVRLKNSVWHTLFYTLYARARRLVLTCICIEYRQLQQRVQCSCDQMPTKQRAVLVTQQQPGNPQGSIEVRDINVPSPAEDEVLLQVLCRPVHPVGEQTTSPIGLSHFMVLLTGR